MTEREKSSSTAAAAAEAAAARGREKRARGSDCEKAPGVWVNQSLGTRVDRRDGERNAQSAPKVPEERVWWDASFRTFWTPCPSDNRVRIRACTNLYDG
jgi:hypothetical protein